MSSMRSNAPVQVADLSSLERARMLVANRFSEDERARESMDRGTEAAELLGKLGTDAETRAVALTSSMSSVFGSW
jgi:hypothetical protein